MSNHLITDILSLTRNYILPLFRENTYVSVKIISFERWLTTMFNMINEAHQDIGLTLPQKIGAWIWV